MKNLSVLRVLLWRTPQILPRRIFLPIRLLRFLRPLAASFFDLRVVAAPRASKNRQSPVEMQK
jgi:hypothetical protein